MIDYFYLQVVVGILQNSKGELLFCKRPSNKAYNGYWEFAGGKIEVAETHTQALKRELKEEIGVEVAKEDMHFVKSIKYKYPHLNVELHFYRIKKWQGKITSLENQEFAWFSLDSFPSPLLPSFEGIISELHSLFKLI
jgi:8-oxo-dGTP diphosphatase